MRRFAWLAAVLAFIPGLAMAAEPAIVVQIKPVEELLADIKYIAKLVNQTDAADQIDGAIQAVAGPKGLAGTGIDTKKPFLMYGVASPGATDSPFAVMIPLADEAAFLRFLEGVNIKAAKGDDGIYSVDVPGIPFGVFFRPANGYIYVSAIDKGHLDDKTIIAPDKLPKADKNAIAAVSLRIDRIPDMLKQLALGQFDLRMAEAKDRAKPGEQPEEAKLKAATADFVMQQVKSLLMDGKSFEAQLVIDRTGDNLALNVSIDGKPNSPLASVISLLGQGKSQFSAPKNDAFHVGVHAGLPEILRPVIGPLIDKKIQELISKETDPGKKMIDQKLLTAVAPTLKAGELDLILSGTGPDKVGHFNFAGAVKVEKGAGIEKAVKEVVAAMPEKDKSKVKLDAGKVGEITIHNVKPEDMDEEGKRLLGEDATVSVGFRDTALFFGAGSATNDAIRDIAVGSKEPQPVVLMEGSLSRLMQMDKDASAVAKQVADKVFGSDAREKDRIRLALEGGSKLKLSITAKGIALNYAVSVDEAKKGS